MKKNLLLAITVLYASITYGQYSESIRSDRPGQSLSPFTLGSQTLQVQSGYNFGEEQGDAVDFNFSNFNNVIRYGLLERLDLNATVNYAQNKYSIGNDETSVEGFNNLSIGARYALYEGKGILPTLGFESRLSLPIESGDFEDVELSAQQVLITQHTIDDRLAITSNWIWMNQDSKNTFNYTLNAAYTISDRWSTFFEFFGNLNHEFSMDYNFGFAYLNGQNLQFDIGLARLTSSANPQIIGDIGISWRTNWR